MRPWSCEKCKKECEKNDLTELFAWGLYVCTPCIVEWLNIKEEPDND